MERLRPLIPPERIYIYTNELDLGVRFAGACRRFRARRSWRNPLRATPRPLWGWPRTKSAGATRKA